MKVDLFIKTCKKDLPWLRYSLLSIDKYAKGFRDVVTVTESEALTDLNYLLKELNLSSNISVRITDIPKSDKSYPHGIGYQWQMGVKLSWIDYSDADAVVMTDSDTIFTDDVTPDTWMHEGKCLWLKRGVEELPSDYPFIKGAEACLKTEVMNDYMCCQGFILTRDIVESFQTYLKDTYNMTAYDYVLEHIHGFSEFCTLGAYVDIVMNSKDYVFRHPRDYDYKPFPMKQYWSWASEDDKQSAFKEIKQLLKI